MAHLSTPIADLCPEYDVVVVGSGYGGAIAALRTAGGRAVCVLERGIERQAGDFPSSLGDALHDVQVESRMGRLGRRAALIDMRVNEQVSVVVGCGLGGTSLINAGVMLEPEGLFDDPKRRERWPAELQKPGALKREYDEVRKVLSANKVPEDIALPKVTQLFAAGQLAKPPSSPGKRPEIAVSFWSHEDTFSVRHRRCTLCGDCFTGCNHAAKNTVDRTYLAQAAACGVPMFCGVQVRAIQPEGTGWRLHIRIVDRAWRRYGEPELTIRAGAVFLAAGTLGSTEILRRSRTRHERLHLSARLGQHFSGNGDAIAFSYNGRERVDGIGYGRRVPDAAAVGPTIAGMLDERTTVNRAMIQEGAVPGLLATPLRFLAPIIARVTRVPGDTAFDLRFRHIGRELHSLLRGARHGALARTQTFLVMSYDDGEGALELRRDRLRVVWPRAGSQAPFRTISTRLAQIASAKGGRFVINPFWSRMFGRRLVTAHPLGGCVMADDASNGVVNAHGQVFKAETGTTKYDNLFVCDGSIVPTPLGTNPALTISALAERIAATATENLPRNGVAAVKPRRIDPTRPGLRYAERLTGWLQLDGKATRVRLVLHISAESVEDLLTRDPHEARIIGVAYVPSRGGMRWTVSSGRLSVLIADPRQVDTKLLVYQLRLTDDTGASVWLHGHKTINLATCRRNLWDAITKLSFVVYRNDRTEPLSVDDPDLLTRLCNAVESAPALRPASEFGVVCGHGRVGNSVADALRLAASLDVMYERRFVRRQVFKLRYAGYFANAVFQARVWPLRHATRPDPLNRRALRLPDGITTCEYIDQHVEGPRFMLTRYRKGQEQKPAVVVAPGFGMSADCFFVGRPSLVEYLCEQGYDVWLLDYRGSDRLDISLTQFTLDDLVTDFKDAFEYVEKATREPVRVIGHCVASLVTQMLLLKDKDAGRYVRSAIVSQTHLVQVQPLLNRLKSWIHLPKVLRVLGVRPVLTSDQDVRSGRGSRLLDWLLRLYPTIDRCSSPVCRRILLMYGEVIQHSHLDRETHDMLFDLFDRANLGLLDHMATIVRHGHAVDRHGRDAYLTEENGGHLTMPITLIQGRLNRLFRPRAAKETIDWIRQFGLHGDPTENEKRFVLTFFDRYAHLDHFLGKEAAKDVFPVLVKALQRMEELEVVQRV